MPPPKIVTDLCQDGYLTRHRRGVRSFYELHPERPLRGLDGRELEVGALLALVSQRGEQEGEATAY